MGGSLLAASSAVAQSAINTHDRQPGCQNNNQATVRCDSHDVTASSENLVHDGRRRRAGEAFVEAVVEVGQRFVVQAQEVQQRGVQVADVDRVSRRPAGRRRRCCRRRCRPSRRRRRATRCSPRGCGRGPCPASLIGMRPNSPPQMTSVSSHRPRCCRSRSRPATGLSVRRHMLRVVFGTSFVGVPAVGVARIELHEAHAAFRSSAGRAGSACRTRRFPFRRCRTAAASRPFRR